MKKVITGVSGFIGSNLFETLWKQDYDIIGFDKDYNAKHRLDSIIPQDIHTYHMTSNFVTKNFRMVWDDINRISSYRYLFDDVDTVYHLAAASDIKQSLKDTQWDFRNNIVGTFNILEMMRKQDINNIIFTSTSALYGEHPPFPTLETEPLVPSSLYSASKICAEYLVRAYNEIYGIKGVILRFGNVVGKHQHRGVIVDFLKKLKENPKELEILGNGQQTKSYFHVSDCVSAMLKIPEKIKKDKIETFNIATYDQVNVNTVANIICKELGLNPVYKYTGGDRGWKGDIPTIALDITKACNTGWKPTYHCEDAIKKAVRELNEVS